MRRMITPGVLALILTLSSPAQATHSVWDQAQFGFGFTFGTYAGVRNFVQSTPLCTTNILGSLKPLVCLDMWNLGTSLYEAARENIPTHTGTGWAARQTHYTYPWNVWALAGTLKTGQTGTITHDAYAYLDWTQTSTIPEGCLKVTSLWNDGTAGPSSLVGVDSEDYTETDLSVTFTSAHHTLVVIAEMTTLHQLYTKADCPSNPPGQGHLTRSVTLLTSFGPTNEVCWPNMRDPGTWAADCPSLIL